MYLEPTLETITSIILPSAVTIGVTCAFWPERMETDGLLLKLIISLSPYPTPESSKWIDVSSPLKIGWTCALNVSVPTDDIPTAPFTVTEIGW